ncbi:MAG: OmpH family outer membrane protein [Bacteroidetes bacterium]|jgi:outer membrane protein|nr:OmpH family outer membrane protein [Bacteroidota bacterium]
MIRRLQSLALLLLVGGLLFAAPAQAQKIGYTNQQLILVNMPEYTNVQQQLQQEAQRQQQELQQEQQQFQQRLQTYQRQQSLLADSVKARREQELRQQQQQLQQSAAQREQELAQRERELMQPLLEELQTAISDVSSQQDIDFVVRTEALLYVAENTDSAVDITVDVARQLGIEVPEEGTEPEPSVDMGGTDTP